MQDRLTAANSLPDDADQALLVGRVWIPGQHPGPSPCVVRDGLVRDLSHAGPTMAMLLEHANLDALVGDVEHFPIIDELEPVLANSAEDVRDPARAHFLAPCDLQAIKASGVTFVSSMLERVIEEQAGGDASRAEETRRQVTAIIGDDLAEIRPGSPEADRIKQVLIDQGAWSQYLEVGIGPDAEIFTKCQPMSSVGTGAEIGIHPISSWNNPEPEIVLAVNSQGVTVGATLGNDVNLRDLEGRSALLLGKAKDNNASCSIGPFIRLFDDHFTIDDVRRAELEMTVKGPDGYRLDGSSSMAMISRDPLDLVGQAIGPNHQYPDGFMLFLGTMFAPTEDRDEPGGGFTHKVGDIVTIASDRLGRLINRVNRSDRIAPWTFGSGALMRNLTERRLI